MAPCLPRRGESLCWWSAHVRLLKRLTFEFACKTSGSSSLLILLPCSSPAVTLRAKHGEGLRHSSARREDRPPRGRGARS